MFDTETKILTAIFVILMFVSFKYAFYFCIFVIFIFLFGFFFTSIGLDIELKNLENCEIYYQEYTGDYDNLYDKITEFNKIKKMFKLSTLTYNPFGIFYDDPSDVQDVKKCRAIYGIIRLNNLETKNEEFLKFLKEKKFITKTISYIQCILGKYNSFFNIQNSFKFISKLIISMTNQKFFNRLYLPKWKENKIKLARNNYKKHNGVLEIIKEGKLEFYISCEKENNFVFHSEETAPCKLKNKKKNL